MRRKNLKICELLPKIMNFGEKMPLFEVFFVPLHVIRKNKI